MYNHKINKLPKNTFDIVLTFPWSDIEVEYAKAFEELHKDLVIEGFRKGKAPKELAKKYLKKEDVYNQLMRSLFPKIYEEVISKQNLKPIMSPKITLLKAKENEEWEVKFTTAQKPEIKLGNYKDKLKEARQNVKNGDIWVPGKEPANKEADNEKLKEKNLQETLNTLLKNVACEVSDLIIQDELNHRLSRLLDDIQKLGLTVEGYLKSKGITMDELKKQYSAEILDTYRIEFILQEIADVEGIKVEKADLDKLFGKIQDLKEKEQAQKQAYFYASLMRKQKTLEYLNSL
ncbi:hypothetical protein A2966_03820 [Candidatus Roizmanbacteria bacterium RIFCSPLOWO2_01_FULL_41_22]|uniref:Trigger factor n=1 Tax=Candidatus Roizmanbacteria bacterium RIFCSPLOWO2_01_FULL_41_22 TaxID=1802067 RepID=A0A1F7J8Z5_9BACT|nr:MAG: hypothetical protein A2966_03820 [Candidatus Roizmanbacteria bacterium RIFCSPLOWO2_01_FULL_41_22]